MSSTEKSVLESLISMLIKNEKRVDTLAKRLDIMEKKLQNYEEKNSAFSDIVFENKSTPETAATRTILIVDDDTKLTTSFKLILENAGYDIEVANTGFSAHILVLKNTYDLVILDWHLRDTFGDKIAETIENRNTDTKIMFITGYAYVLDEYKRDNEILLKPIDPDYLLDRVANILSNKQDINVRAQIQSYRKEQGLEQSSQASIGQ